MSTFTLAAWVFASGLVNTGCQSLTGIPKPARLDSPEKSVQQTLQKQVSYALGSRVNLSSRALTNSSQLIIDTHSPKSVNGHQGGMKLGRPDHFTLWKLGNACILKHEESAREWTLKNTRCVVVE